LGAIVLILGLTIFNTNSIRTSANLNKLILYLVFLGLGTIVVFGIGSGKADLSQSLQFATPADKPINISVMFTAMLAAFWGYQGWTSIGFLGGEIKDPNINLPKGIVIGTLIIVGIYFLVNMTYMSVLSISELQDVHAAGNKVAAIEVMRS